LIAPLLDLARNVGFLMDKKTELQKARWMPNECFRQNQLTFKGFTEISPPPADRKECPFSSSKGKK